MAKAPSSIRAQDWTRLLLGAMVTNLGDSECSSHRTGQTGLRGLDQLRARRVSRPAPRRHIPRAPTASGQSSVAAFTAVVTGTSPEFTAVGTAACAALLAAACSPFTSACSPLTSGALGLPGCEV